MTYRGFTIIEVLVTTAIAMMITGFLITNFSRSRNDLAATAPSVLGDVRKAQSFAIAGSQFRDAYRCGFGVLFEKDAYTVYAGPPAGTCAIDDMRTFATGEPIDRIVLQDSLEFKTTGDVYFVPPLPYTYLNGTRNDPSMSDTLLITIGVRNRDCAPSRCRTILIDEAGQITSVIDDEQEE